MYLGYGIRTDNWKLREDAYERLLDMMSEARKSNIFDSSYQYYLDNRDDYQTHEESFYDFCEDWYENEWNLASGIESVITDYINEQEFRGSQIFVFQDWCIHVPAYIRETENPEDLWKYPSIERIKAIFSKYVDPLLEIPQCIAYYTIKP